MSANLVSKILQNPARFFVLSTTAKGVDALLLDLSATGAMVKTLDGSLCRTKAAFMEAAAKALSFPDYFGRNWDAFNDSFDELSWTPPHRLILVIRNSELLLVDNKEDLGLFIELLGESFKDDPEKPGTSLKVILQHEDAADVSVLEAVAAETSIPLARLP